MSPPKRRWRALLALAASAVALPLVTAQAATPPPYPGLPPGEGAQWGGVAQRGIASSGRAQQWFYVPANVATADVVASAIPNPEPGVNFRILNTNNAFFVSPPGSSHDYGDLAPVVVRSLAFGAIPVQVTVHINQQRNADGTPVPIKLSTQEDQLKTVEGEQQPRWTLYDSSATAKLELRLSDLSIDGQPVPLGPACRPVRASDLVLRGEGYTNVATIDRAALTSTVAGLQRYYAAGGGGRLTGNVDIPPFAGCRHGTEDLSPLLTATISGPDNPLVFQLSGPRCAGREPLKGIAPGDGAKLSACGFTQEDPTYQTMDLLRLPSRD
ncbi:hypothetical protein [Nocardioides plantarum]|uniref:Secreted protein n=1 Tax=Nocardioides plantarum TaxID=29299 RepID=A0ABV5KFF3_9ACTN|nr:hypothetical protein [Nocardioides plantarum]